MHVYDTHVALQLDPRRLKGINIVDSWIQSSLLYRGASNKQAKGAISNEAKKEGQTINQLFGL